MSRSARALVVGAGPAAAYAVQACKDLGLRCTVISNRQPSTEQAGAFFLHWLPESLRPAKQHRVLVSSEGTELLYLTKQWPEQGERPVGSSFPLHTRESEWYNSTELARVWEHQSVIPLLAPLSDHDLQHAGFDYGWVFHTFPSKASLQRRKVTRFPTLTHPTGAAPAELQVLYDGTARARVRVTKAWGRLSVEYPASTPMELLLQPQPEFSPLGPLGWAPELVWLRDIHPTTAPVRPSEHLWKNVHPVGRYATWERHYLSHDAYFSVWFWVTGVPHPAQEVLHAQPIEA